jgi:hypothetical protein
VPELAATAVLTRMRDSKGDGDMPLYRPVAADVLAQQKAASGTPPELIALVDLAYVLQGHIASGGVFVRQGVAPAAIAIPELYLVYRLQTLSWHPALLASILNQIAAWEHAGSRVAGIEFDFDARTPRLADYAAFLREIRAALPRAYRLGVIGLLDWSTGGAPEAFTDLAGTIDEIVFQTYRGRQTILNYRDYLGAVARLTMPFKIGIVEGGVWDRGEERRLAASPFYRGVVVFLTTRR